MAEEKSGFIGWKIGQEPNLVAIIVGYFCCCFLGIWNFHLYLEEIEKELGISSNLHWVKVILYPFGMLELDKELCKLECKAGKSPEEEGFFSVSLIACLPCLHFLLPFKLVKLMKRANGLKPVQAPSEQA